MAARLLPSLLPVPLLLHAAAAWQYAAEGPVYGRPTFSHDGRTLYVTAMSYNLTSPAGPFQGC
jgi:hypothetical protein